MLSETDWQELDHVPTDNTEILVYVVDVETSGLRPWPHDIVFSIAISEVNINQGTVQPFYNKILGYDVDGMAYKKKNAWIFDNSDLSIEKVGKAFRDGDTAEWVGKEVKKLLKGKYVAIYNKLYDYDFYLQHIPFQVQAKVLPCLMMASTKPCAIPSRSYQEYKWPTLEQAANILLDDETLTKFDDDGKYHNAEYDTKMTGFVMLRLIELGHYNILEYIANFDK